MIQYIQGIVIAPGGNEQVSLLNVKHSRIGVLLNTHFHSLESLRHVFYVIEIINDFFKSIFFEKGITPAGPEVLKLPDQLSNLIFIFTKRVVSHVFTEGLRKVIDPPHLNNFI